MASSKTGDLRYRIISAGFDPSALLKNPSTVPMDRHYSIIALPPVLEQLQQMNFQTSCQFYPARCTQSKFMMVARLGSKVPGF